MLNSSPGESCTYRILGSTFEDLLIKSANFTMDCSEGDMWIVTADETFGPFCESKRKRRAVYHDYDLNKAVTDRKYKTEEMDLVFRNGQSIKMKFVQDLCKNFGKQSSTLGSIRCAFGNVLFLLPRSCW